MRDLIVSDVGDGLCMAVSTISGKIVQIDCGGKNGRVAFSGLLKTINHFNRIDALVLSHYHIDHYNGIIFASKVRNFPFTIKEVYYPRIPEFKERRKFQECLFAINARVLGSETGVAEYDFLKAISRINRGMPFRKKGLTKGDRVNINSSIFEVLWPPAKIDAKEVVVPIKRAITDFEKALEEDEITGRLYDRIKDDGIFRTLDEEEENWEDPRISENIRIEKRKLPNVVKKANKSLLKAANHLGLAMFKDNQLLFLGDAEKFEIKQIVDDLKFKRRLLFSILITPHHGTHWHNTLREIRCVNSISSNGKRLCSKLNQNYKKISCNSYATFTNGDIEMSPISKTKLCPLFS